MRHKTSLRLLLSAVHSTDNADTWEVDSSEPGKVYSVTQLNKTCPYKCSTRCAECEICVHMFICSCPDALIKGSICKHIHLVGRLCLNPITEMDLADNSDSDSPEPSLSLPEADGSLDSGSPGENVGQSILLTTPQDKTQLSETSAVKNDVHTSILSLAGYIHNIDDVGILKEIKTRVMSTVNFIKANNQIRPSLPKTNSTSNNTYRQTKVIFFNKEKKKSKCQNTETNCS
jgi:hypothetical protein